MNVTKANDFMRLLKIIHIRIEETVNETMENYDLTAAQCDILGYLMEHECQELNSTKLHQNMHLSKANISALIKKLRFKGFLEFAANPKDDRQKHIVVTSKAKQLDQEMHDKLHRMQKCLFKDLTESEIDMAAFVLNKMLQNVGKSERRSEYGQNNLGTDQTV